MRARARTLARPQRVERAQEILGWLGLEAHRLAGDRVGEREERCVQGLPAELARNPA